MARRPKSTCRHHSLRFPYYGRRRHNHACNTGAELVAEIPQPLVYGELVLTLLRICGAAGLYRHSGRLDDNRGRSSTLDGLWPCLLYTSDAADDLLCVDLGG